MKLDPRIENESSIYTPFLSDDKISQLVFDKWGYFTDDYKNFSDLKKCTYGKLISYDDDCRFRYQTQDFGKCHFASFYIPDTNLHDIIEPRPFTLDDLKDIVDYGDILKIRTKSKITQMCLMYIGCMVTDATDTEPKKESVMLGNMTFTMKELFDNFEYYDNDHDEWRNFEVEV